MKLMLFNCLLLVSLSAKVLPQGDYSLNIKNTSFREALKQIEDNSGLRFFYNEKFIELDKKIDLKVNNVDQVELLQKLFADQTLTYKVLEDNFVVITPSELKQETVVKGKIADTDGNPLPGVNIVEKGTTNGAVSDLDGNYSISVANTNAVLVFSYVGFLSEEIEVAGQTTIDMTMVEDIQALDEVVVVGYGSMKKSDLTGSVSSVNSEEISAYPSTGVVQALQGRAAGVQILAKNGAPGSSYKVRVRGATSINSSSDPLYVVDGFPGATMPPSEDIESVEVLKDASATAIYGSRGANGVILVTTKRGQKGKTQVEFNTSYSVQQEIDRFDVLETPDFIDYLNEVSPGTFDPQGDYENTDWQDLILQNGAVQNYQLSVSGGDEKYKYYVSGILYDQEGIIIESNYKRYSIISNLDLNVNDHITTGINLFGAGTTGNGVLTQETSGGSGGTGVMSAAVMMEPTVGIYDDNGDYTLATFGDPHDNPYAVAQERENESASETLQGNFFAEIKILPGLTFKSTFGIKSYNSRNGSYTPSTLNAGRQVNGSGRIENRRNVDLINENYFTFDKNVNNTHHITLMGGYSYQSGRYEFSRAESQVFITDAFSFWDLDGGSNPRTPNSSITETELASYYGRLNYKLLDRYLVTFNARYDGSSRFAKNNKWAFFPSGAVAWNVAEESFMQGIPQISQLKLRGSYGVTGNQAIGAYQSLARFGTMSSTIVGNELVNAIIPSNFANNDLTWESTSQLDIGFDFGMFNNRIHLVADYYKMETEDLLFTLPLPEYTGISGLLKNIGSIENKGIEFTLSTANFVGDFKWSTDLNFSRNRNKVLELPEGNDIFIGSGPGHMVGIGNTQVLREDEPLGVFYGYVYDGVYQEGDVFLTGGGFEQEPGGEKYRDLNDDGALSAGDDRQIIGDPNPDFIWGLNNTFEYKNFDLNLFFQGSQGNDIYSFTLMELELLSGIANTTTRALDRWTPTNTDTDVPKAAQGRGRISSDRHIYDGSYARLKNISVGYKLPKSIISRIGLSYAKIYVSGQNILTISDYPGIDPEVSWNSNGNYSSNVRLGLDYGSYPNSKSYTIGLQVKF